MELEADMREHHPIRADPHAISHRPGESFEERQQRQAYEEYIALVRDNVARTKPDHVVDLIGHQHRAGATHLDSVGQSTPYLAGIAGSIINPFLGIYTTGFAIGMKLAEKWTGTDRARMLNFFNTGLDPPPFNTWGADWVLVRDTVAKNLQNGPQHALDYNRSSIEALPIEAKQFGHPGQAALPRIRPVIRSAPPPDKQESVPAPIIAQILGPVHQAPQRNIWDRMIDDHQSTYYDREGELTWAQMSFGYCTPSAAKPHGSSMGMMHAASISSQSLPTGSITPNILPQVPDPSTRLVPPPPAPVSAPMPAPVAPAPAQPVAPAPMDDPDAREPPPDDEDTQPEEQPQNPGGGN